MLDFQIDFIRFAIDRGALSFGPFRTKANRLSPYFFNSGAFDDGGSLNLLSSFYARKLRNSEIEFDMIFGSAYKGIQLAVGLSSFLSMKFGFNYPFSFNRKEIKDHGEGGLIVGAPLAGRVLIVDDVISAGISTRAAIELIRGAGAVPAGLLVALDRMERGRKIQASEEIRSVFGIPVIPIVTLDDILEYISGDARFSGYTEDILSYKRQH